MEISNSDGWAVMNGLGVAHVFPLLLRRAPERARLFAVASTYVLSFLLCHDAPPYTGAFLVMSAPKTAAMPAEAKATANMAIKA